MISITIVLSVCASGLYAQFMHYAFKRERMHWKNNDQLSDLLEKKLKEMEELKNRMEGLLLKNGLGRK